MDIIILLIAVGLAMDSFSVSITRGFTNKTNHLIEALKTGFFFGLFQGIMPIMGWIAGISVKEFISGFDHWIAFGLLFFIGARMIYESLSRDAKQVVSSSSLKVLLTVRVVVRALMRLPPSEPDVLLPIVILNLSLVSSRLSSSAFPSFSTVQ